MGLILKEFVSIRLEGQKFIFNGPIKRVTSTEKKRGAFFPAEYLFLSAILINERIFTYKVFRNDTLKQKL